MGGNPRVKIKAKPPYTGYIIIQYTSEGVSTIGWLRVDVPIERMLTLWLEGWTIEVLEYVPNSGEPFSRTPLSALNRWKKHMEEVEDDQA
jgi:hypothetical protein